MNESTFNPMQDNLDQFRDALLKARAITPLDVLSHGFLMELDTKANDGTTLGINAQKLLYIFLSLMNDGNTCYALDSQKLNDKWSKKWEGLSQLAGIDAPQTSSDSDNSKDGTNDSFENLINAGIHEIFQNNKIVNTHLFEERTEKTPEGAITRPFVICTDNESTSWCYAAKYFDAKCIIEAQITKLFKKSDKISNEDAQLDEFLVKTNLRDKQKEAIRRGMRENLIITGGPGTGKTTVVCYLLWCLLKHHPEMQTYKIYLAAPSGKAADRMRESISETIEKIPGDKSDPVRKIIADLESYTIHRLLKYKPSGRAFSMDADNKFPTESIFVIDEASMIDIALFASLLDAIPEGARVFILGDPDQLPSVDAGAVLGDLLGANIESVVQLIESNRFNDESRIGKLAHSIQHKPEIPFIKSLSKDCWGTPTEDENYINDRRVVLDKINTIQLGDSKNEKSKDTIKQIQDILKRWTDRFYASLPVLAEAINPDLNDDRFETEQQDALDKLWQHASLARILSAERSGKTGVETLNRAICATLKHDSGDLFAGKLLMLTRNQSGLKLYNGDSGIVLQSQRDKQFYLLLKKPHIENNIQRSFVKYPMSVLPSDAIEDAFAITVHKAQGSGYPHVMVFLPTRKRHPLLNRQIVYTAVTRTMGQSISIISNEECFKDACQTDVKRDTGIKLK